MTPSRWLAPVGLVLLAAVPVAAGAARLTELAGGATVTPENARFFAMPAPVVVHIISVTVYAFLGAFQFLAGPRRRWHRISGRIVVLCGLGVALSGLWMTLFYPRPSGDGELLEVFRLVFGSAMLASIVLGFAAIRRREFSTHRAWTIRAYAIAMGAGTQVFTNLPWLLVLGTPDVLSRAMLMFAGWAINIAVAEWLIRKQPTARRRVVLVA